MSIESHNEHMAKQIFGKGMTLTPSNNQSSVYKKKVETVIRENASLFATIYISKSDVGEKFQSTVESLLDD